MREYYNAVKASTVPVSGKELCAELGANQSFSLVISVFTLASLALKWLSIAQKAKLMRSSGETLRQLIEGKLVDEAVEVLDFLRSLISPDDEQRSAAERLKICVVLRKHNATAQDLQKIVQVWWLV
jgi:hypothetical protein